jgi:hypothetical protein
MLASGGLPRVSKLFLIAVAVAVAVAAAPGCGRIGYDALDLDAAGSSPGEAGMGGTGAGGTALAGAGGTGQAGASAGAASGTRDGGPTGGASPSMDATGDGPTGAGGTRSCSTQSSEDVFAAKMRAAFPLDIQNWDANGGGLCSGVACNGADLVCAPGNCGLYTGRFRVTPSSFVCQAGATCRVIGSDGQMHFTNPVICESGSVCYLSAFNGVLEGPVICRSGATCSFLGRTGALLGATCETGATCYFDCTNGTCTGLTIEPGATALLNCDTGNCDRVACPPGATCIARCTNTADCPTCAAGADCACITGSALTCQPVCGGSGAPPPCASAGAEHLRFGCWGF